MMPHWRRRLNRISAVCRAEQTDIVKLYKGKLPIFEHFGSTNRLNPASENSDHGNGSYLIVEHTEAMHVIDVIAEEGKIRRRFQSGK